ncbi:Alpha-D-kanosaminyltransferase [Caulifigura coniformis]|uniref:Alpha-D-kanosaminyltransferase n=1 Tax=Caulifigura coniformis TaxID=2527983 RepID=A0A517SI92_9PLAN|nr:glycosyltransferase [Caulifigura coniformis]QDT55835.1 Alpha-D-kanosaminyltransferase [Caulifigura coniformis]
MAVNVVVLFYNIGPYHIARLESARRALEAIGGKLAAIQIVATTSEHPWGAVDVPDYVTTLEEFQAGNQPRLSSPRLLTEALDRLRPDAVAVPGWGFDFARQALKWCRKNDVARVLMSESHRDDAPRAWWKERIKSVLWISKFDSALVGGVLHSEYLQSLGMPGEKIFFGYDLVDNEGFAADVDAARGGNLRPTAVSSPYFLASSRFMARKNLGRLIDAFQMARERQGDQFRHQLVILGDGPLRRELESQIERGGLKEVVHLPGFLTRQEIIPWLGFADAFVHPALHEQWGLVVNEAMAAAVPVAVSRNCGCFPELVVEGVTGFGFDPESVSEMADSLCRLSDLGDRRSAMGLEARRHLNEGLPVSRFGEGLVDAVQTALRSTRSKAV